MAYTGEKKKQYQLEWIQKRRNDWIASKGNVCALCGGNESLEVDHIDPGTKLMNPAQIWSRKESDRVAMVTIYPWWAIIESPRAEVVTQE